MKFKKLTWPKNRSVKNATLDEHHEQFVEISNEIIDMANEASSDVNALLDLLTKLGNQVIYHFEVEEEYLKGLHFPEVTEHLKSHEEQRIAIKNFIMKIRDAQRVCKGPSECRPLVEEVAEFVTHWVGKHMMGGTGTEAFFAKLGEEKQNGKI